MLSYVIAGLALGGVYAISSASLVATYKSTGVLNFGFGAMAYFVARLFYFLNSQHGWSIGAAGVLSILVAGPVLGAFLYLALFRFLRLSSTLIKIVVTLGLQVVVPPITDLAFGSTTIFQAPGLAPQPVKVFHVLGATISMDQIIVYICVLVIVVGGGVILRYTEVGLRVRAMVDSPAMTSLSGSSPTATSLGVWSVSVFLAGLAGVLTAPILGLDSGNYNLLMAAAFAAVVVAQLKNLPVAVVVGLTMGIAGSLFQRYLPPENSWTSVVVPSIPFAVTALFLLYQVIRRGATDEASGVGGALDRAIAVQEDLAATSSTTEVARKSAHVGSGPALAGFVIVAILPLILHGFWVGLVALGVAYGITFLAYSLVVGEGGMVWLCIISFAGVGAITAGQLSGRYGWPVLAAVVVGGLIALPMGVILGALTVRLGNLYVALVTLTFGLLMENLVFTRETFLKQDLGVALSRPSFARSDKAFTYLALIIFAIVGLFIVNLRRSTTGMALTAVRSSEPSAKTTGVSVFQMKVIVAGLGAFVAGLGGAVYAVDRQVALPPDFSTLAGVLWLAVLVTQGIRSNMAALIAGLSLTIMPALFQTYLPVTYGQIPSILFGLGAIAVARNPDGVLAMQARQLRTLIRRLRSRQPAAVGALAAAEMPADAPTSADAPATGVSAMVEPMAPQPSVPSYSAGRLNSGAAEVPVLDVDDVVVRFGGVVALDHVGLEVPPASLVGLVGPNGAGKTTMFHVCSGLLKPNAGKVTLLGQDITDLSPQARARLGLARTFQQPEVFRGLSVADHLRLAYRARHQRSRLWKDMFTGGGFRPIAKDEEERVDFLLELLMLKDLADVPVDVLPLGTTRLVEVGRALAGGPKLVLLDEPLSGLDSNESKQLAAALRRTVDVEGISLLLVEHDVAMVLSLCSNIYVIDFGHRIAVGPPDVIRNDAAVKAAYLGEAPIESHTPHQDKAVVAETSYSE